MTTNKKKIIEQALDARTLEEATAVQELIASAIGARHQRPLGDTWNNQGILTGSGASYDHKALEVVTNMQDAVLELAAIPRARLQGGHSLQEPPRCRNIPLRRPRQEVEVGVGNGNDRQGRGRVRQEKGHLGDARPRMRNRPHRRSLRHIPCRNKEQRRHRLAAGHLRARRCHYLQER